MPNNLLIRHPASSATTDLVDAANMLNNEAFQRLVTAERNEEYAQQLSTKRRNDLHACWTALRELIDEVERLPLASPVNVESKKLLVAKVLDAHAFLQR